MYKLDIEHVLAGIVFSKKLDRQLKKISSQNCSLHFLIDLLPHHKGRTYKLFHFCTLLRQQKSSDLEISSSIQ